MIKQAILSIIFLIGFFYLIMPGPASINDIPPLPASLKSKEPGDTTQVPNIAAYFSDARRREVTEFYRQQFSYMKFLGFTIPPIRLNHPPEESYGYIRDQQSSTYLEQYVYPLRDSIYVNGFEPFDLSGKPYKRGATSIYIEGKFFDTKTTLRYYGSSVAWRIIIYFGIWISGYFLVKMIAVVFRKKQK